MCIRTKIPAKRSSRCTTTIEPTQSENSLLILELKAVFVFLEEGAQILGGVKQADPLLVVERDGETAEPVNADAALFTDTEFECALSAARGLFFQFGDAREQFFLGRFCHDSSCGG